MKKAWTWSAYISPFIGQPMEAILANCQHAGLSAVDGTYRFFQNHSDTEMEAFATAFRKGGIGIKTFHLPFGGDDTITSFYETIRRKAVEKIKIWMEKASAMGAEVGIQHPSSGSYSVDVEGLDHYMKQLSKSLDELLPLAEKLNFTLAIENLPSRGRFGTRPEHFTAIIENFAHPNIGFCLDTGHALVSMGPERAGEFLEIMAPHLVAFHLSDNAGDRDSHLAPGHGRVDFDPVFQKAAEIGFSRPMCIETAPFAHGPPYAPDAWKQMVDDTNDLAKNSLASLR